MKRRVRALLAALICLPLLGAGSAANASAGAKAQWTNVEFSLKPRDQTEPPWTVRLDARGAGNYSEAGSSTQQPLNVSVATVERIAHGEHRARLGRCETRQKKIAETGQKTIRYTGAEEDAGCTFNYSDDSELMDTVQVFLAIAETMQAGQRLKHDLRYDRLALDAEMDSLLANVKSGGAIEVANIAPVLHSLVDDDHVIDRVRRKAARLLQDSGVPDAGTASTR